MAQQQMSLFGPSLAQTQAGIAQEDEAITAKLAQLSPEQQLTRVALQGGRQAGKALGGLFGIEDPRLKEAAQQEAIFKELKDSGVDFTDSEQLYPALINAYQSRGMIDKAIVAAAKYEDVKSTSLKTQAELGLKGAQTKKALADAAKALKENLPSIAKLQELRQQLMDSRAEAETPEQLTEINQRIKEVSNAINKESTFAPPAPIKPRKEGVSETGQIVYFDPAKEEQFTLDAKGNRVPFTGKIREGSSTNITLNTGQTAALVEQGQKATKSITDRVESIDRSLALIQQNTPFSEAALRQEISSIFGDANKAAIEIKALANTGSLDERIANRVVNFVSGKDTKVTNEDRKAVLLALRKREQEQYERRLTPYRQAIKEGSGGNPTAIFPSFEEAFGVSPGTATGKRKTKSGTEYTVE